MACAKLEVAYLSGIHQISKTVNNRDGNLNIFMNEETVKKRIAVVTGAGRGIGRGIAEALAQDGAHVICVSKSESSCGAAADFIREQGGNAEKHECIDILVNNAGITRDNLLFRMDEEDWESVLTTNLTSCFHWIKGLARPMTRKRWGRIVNVASVVGITGNAGQANYSAAKAGMIGLTKSLAREFSARSVTVNAIAPGFIDTDMTSELDERVKEGALSTIPLKRFGQVPDIAEMAAFLCSDKASYVTGQVFTVDGGMVM